MTSRMTPPAEGQEKDVLLVLNKQQGKIGAVKGFDKEGNLQTVSPTAVHGGELIQVDKNSDAFNNFLPSFYCKYQGTSGLGLLSAGASGAERNAGAIGDNHHNPTPGDGKRTEMSRMPKPDSHEFRQSYRLDPTKINWENLEKIGITTDTLKNTKDFDRVVCDHKSYSTYTISGMVGGFYPKPTDVKLSFYRAKDGTVVPKLHGAQQDEKLLRRPFHGHDFTKQEQGSLQGTGDLDGITKIENPKSGEQIPTLVGQDRYTYELEYTWADKWKHPDTICSMGVSLEQRAASEAGRAIKMGNLQFRDGTKRSVYLQVSTVEHSLELLSYAAAQFLQQGQQQVARLKDEQGVEFNDHVQPGTQGKSPDRVQPKDITPATESRTQVAVNTKGKTNEATKQGKEPLKQGQQRSTTKQKEEQDKAQDKSLKVDKPKKSKGMRMQYPPLKNKGL